MASPDAGIADLACAQHGVFTRRQALLHGLSGRQIDGRLRRGLWYRVHPGVYGIRGTQLSFEGSALAAVIAVGPSACASHTTAAVLWRLNASEAGDIEISVRDRVQRRLEGVVVHVPRTLRPRDVSTIGRIPITTPDRTLVDLSAVLDRPALEDVVDDAIRRKLVTPHKLLERLGRTASYGRRGLPLLHALFVERVGRSPSGSRLENTVRRALTAAGLPEPVPQYEIRTHDGTFVARVDFAYPDAKVAIEVDGYAYHSGRRAWEHDGVRQNRLVSLGWTPLRITSGALLERPQEFVAHVWRVLATSKVGQTRQTEKRGRSGASYRPKK